jgi:hypothetical protein
MRLDAGLHREPVMMGIVHDGQALALHGGSVKKWLLCIPLQSTYL